MAPKKVLKISEKDLASLDELLIYDAYKTDLALGIPQSPISTQLAQLIYRNTMDKADLVFMFAMLKKTVDLAKEDYSVFRKAAEEGSVDALKDCVKIINIIKQINFLLDQATDILNGSDDEPEQVLL